MATLNELYSTTGSPASTMTEAMSNLRKYFSEADDPMRAKIEARLAKEQVGNQAQSLNRFGARLASKTGGMTPLQGYRANLGKTAQEEAYQKGYLNAKQNQIENKLQGIGLLSSLADTQNKLYGNEAGYLQERKGAEDEQLLRQMKRNWNLEDYDTAQRRQLEDIYDKIMGGYSDNTWSDIGSSMLSSGFGVLGNVAGRTFDRWYEGRGNNNYGMSPNLTYNSGNNTQYNLGLDYSLLG